MININKNITLTGNIEINGAPVANLSATLATDGNKQASINRYISNQDLYSSNKAEVRNDIAEFETVVYAVEDEIAKEVAVQKAKLEKRGK